jgi:hypothetical protein
MRSAYVSPLFALLFALVPACSSSSNGATTPESDTGVAETSVDTGLEAGGTQCTAARQTAVAPVAKVSAGEVVTVSTTGATKTLYVNAVAGGMNGGATNPWIYVKLATASRVDINDSDAFDSTAWDLAFKRSYIHTNSGDAGPGVGGARSVGKDFDAVTAADAVNLKAEAWFDADCNLKQDAIGGISTTFDGWYDYDTTTSKVTPKALTYIVRAADGALFKMAIETYYGTSTGGTTTAGANYLVKVAAL